MSAGEKVCSGAGGGARPWSVPSGVPTGAGVLVSLHLLSRSNYPLFHSVIEALEQGYRWFLQVGVTSSLDCGGSPGVVTGFIADVHSLGPARRRRCRDRKAVLPEDQCPPGNAACGGRRNDRNEAGIQCHQESMAMAD